MFANSLYVNSVLAVRASATQFSVSSATALVSMASESAVGDSSAGASGGGGEPQPHDVDGAGTTGGGADDYGPIGDFSDAPVSPDAGGGGAQSVVRRLAWLTDGALQHRPKRCR